MLLFRNKLALRCTSLTVASAIAVEILLLWLGLYSTPTRPVPIPNRVMSVMEILFMVVPRTEYEEVYRTLLK